MKDKKKIFLILLVFIPFFSLFAQESMPFSEQSLNVLNFGERKKLKNLTKNPLVRNVQIVRFNDILLPLHSGGKVNLPDPNSTCGEAVFEREEYEDLDDGGYVWTGSIKTEDDCACRSGYVFLQNSSDGFIGTYHIDEVSYMIRSLGSNYFAVLAYEFEQRTPICTAKGKMLPELELPTRNQRTSFCNIDVLVLHDAESNVNGDIASIASGGINQTNTALNSSGLTPEQIKLVLIGVEEVSINSSPFNIDGDLNELINDFQDLKEERGADLVVYLSSVDYNLPTVTGVLAGAAGSFSTIPNPDRMFAIVETDLALTANLYTFAHEVGHLLGAGHNGTAAPSQGHKFITRHGLFNLCRKRWKTLMHIKSVDDEYTRLLRFSNPDINYIDVPTGIENDRDNASVIGANACFVANMVDGNQSNLAIELEGASTGCDGSPANINVEICCAPGPFSIFWEHSENGIDFYPLSYNTNQEILEWAFPPNVGMSEFVRVRVVAANGQEATDIHKITTVCYDGYGRTNAEQLIALDVGPNPSNGRLIIRIENSSSIQGGLKIYSALGQLVYESAEYNLDAGNHQYYLSLLNLKGLYFVQLTTSEGKITKKIFFN